MTAAGEFKVSEEFAAFWGSACAAADASAAAAIAEAAPGIGKAEDATLIATTARSGGGTTSQAGQMFYVQVHLQTSEAENDA